MDGCFVPNISLGAPIVRSMRKATDLVLDVHLMIDRPERYLDDFLSAGSDLITIHVESTDKVQEIIDRIHAAGKRAGITLKPGTPVEALTPYLPSVDVAMIMTVEPGFGGQSFMPEQLEKAKFLREYKEKNGRDFDVEVDGGVNMRNVRQCLASGINVIVAGSSVYKGDATKNASEFMKVLEQ